MTDRITKESVKDASVEEGEDVIRNKKSLEFNDFKEALTKDKSDFDAKNYRHGFAKIALWIFSIILLVTGVFVMVFTVYTVFGVILGLAMIVAGIILPFVFRGDWIEKRVD